jgi:hypothetical protein
MIVNNRFALAMSLAIASSLVSNISQAQTAPATEIKPSVGATLTENTQAIEKKSQIDIGTPIKLVPDKSTKVENITPKIDPSQVQSRTVMCLW